MDNNNKQVVSKRKLTVFHTLNEKQNFKNKNP